MSAVGIKSLAYVLLEDAHCTECNQDYDLQTIELKKGESADYIGSYLCENCTASYGIRVEDDDEFLEVKTNRLDLEIAPNFSQYMSSRKGDIYREIHSASDLVRGLGQLNQIQSVLLVNKERILEHHETLKQGDNPRGELETLRADVHNFLASAYSLEQIYNTLDTTLPTDGQVADVKAEYDENKRVVLGLRTYAQHELNFTISYGVYTKMRAGKAPETITIPLEEVRIIESATDRYPPDGYRNNHPYESVESDDIDVVAEVKRFSDSAENLVEAISSHMENKHGSELDDYREKTNRDYSGQ